MVFLPLQDFFGLVEQLFLGLQNHHDVINSYNRFDPEGQVACRTGGFEDPVFHKLGFLYDGFQGRDDCDLEVLDGVGTKLLDSFEELVV